MKPKRRSFPAPGITGEVVAKFGRHFLVRVDENRTIPCILRGRKNDAACGDHVEVRLAGVAQGVIEAVLPRTSLLHRSDAAHEKLVAANVTQVIIVTGAVPSFSEELLNRCLVAAENERLSILIVLNKSDLVEPAMAALVTLELYRDLGYPVLPLSATTSVDPLLPFLSGHLSVLIGQSGMGKSTIINTLIPSATRATGDISSALDAGRHTTTHARLYYLDERSRIIDSPGVQQFGLHHLDDEEICWAFAEFRPYIGKCRFNNCRHAGEPDCALTQAAQENKIERRRLEFYRKLTTHKQANLRQQSTENSTRN